MSPAAATDVGAGAAASGAPEAAAAPARLPLAGIRVLALAHLYPGPLASMLLADLGADVIIVEGPSAPDRTRRFPGHFEALNRNKRAVCIDLKTDAGKQAFLRLVDTADAVLEGFRPGVMARLGLDGTTLRARNPRLVFASISGYGQTGPLSHHAAHDLSLQGAVGMLNIPPGEEATHPLPALVLADIAAGNAAALGIVTALLQRERTAHAPSVDVSMLDCLATWMAPALVPALNGLQPARLPPTDPGYGVFRSADGVQFTLSISGEDHLWRALCNLLGLAAHAALQEEARIEQRAQVQLDLRAALQTHTMPWLQKGLDEAGLPWGPVLGLKEMAQSAQVVARGIVVDHVSDTGETMRYVRQPVVFDGAGTAIKQGAPTLGGHNGEVL